MDELQKLGFGVMNFSDFYDDLDADNDIPEDQALLKKAQDIIAEKMKQKTRRLHESVRRYAFLSCDYIAACGPR